MANPIILDYFRKYSKKYNLEQLKQKIVSSGYSAGEVDEAIEILGLESNENIPKLEQKKDFKNINYSKWLKIAGIAGILAFVVPFLSSIISLIINPKIIFGVSILLTSVLSILFFYGFVVLGKKYNQKLIKIVSWIFIFIAVLGFGFVVTALIAPDVFGSMFTMNLEAETPEQLFLELGSLLATMFLLLAGIFLVFIALNILFGIGFIKLKENVKYAKVTGILLIAGASSLIIFVGALGLSAALIFEIIILFNESKKY